MARLNALQEVKYLVDRFKKAAGGIVPSRVVSPVSQRPSSSLYAPSLSNIRANIKSPSNLLSPIPSSWRNNISTVTAPTRKVVGDAGRVVGGAFVQAPILRATQGRVNIPFLSDEQIARTGGTPTQRLKGAMGVVAPPMFRTGATIAGLANPARLIATAGIGGGIGAGIEKITGGNAQEGFMRGVGNAPQLAGVLGPSNKFFSSLGLGAKTLPTQMGLTSLYEIIEGQLLVNPALDRKTIKSWNKAKGVFEGDNKEILQDVMIDGATGLLAPIGGRAAPKVQEFLKRMNRRVIITEDGVSRGVPAWQMKLTIPNIQRAIKRLYLNMTAKKPTQGRRPGGEYDFKTEGEKTVDFAGGDVANIPVRNRKKLRSEFIKDSKGEISSELLQDVGGGGVGALAGFEKDENGKLRYNPAKGAFGAAVGVGASRQITGRGVKLGLGIEDVSKSDDLAKEARKYKTTVNIQDKNDIDYLRRIFSDDQIKDIQAGKMTNWRGTPYEDLGKVNIISKTPKTIEQQLSGRIKDVQLKSDTFYHGTSANSAREIMGSGFKSGSELPENAYRGGGYGKIQEGVSFAETPREAGIFSTLTKGGEIVEAKLKKGAKVVTIDGVEDAVELADYTKYLKKQGVDAVYIGGGEKELVVLNTKAVTPIKSQLTDIYNKATKGVGGETTQKALPEPRKVALRRQAQELENIIKKTPTAALDTGVPLTTHKLKPEVVMSALKNPESVSGYVAMRKLGDKTVPAIRKESGIFAPKEFETFNGKDISGLAGGRSYNIRDAALAYDNLTPQAAAKRGGFGPMTKLAYETERAVAEQIDFALSKGAKITSLAKKHNIPVNKKTGEQLFDAMEGKTKGIDEGIARLAKDLRKELDGVRQEANTVRKSLGKKEMGYIENYAPHVREVNFWRDLWGSPKTTISDNFDYIIPNAKKNPHALSRTGGMVGKEKNMWKLLDGYLDAISNDIYKSPTIEKLKAANSVIKGKGHYKMSDLVEKHIREQLVGKPAAIDSYLGITEGSLKRAGLQKINMARNISALAGNIVWTAIVQPASSTLTVARSGGVTRGLQNTLGGMVDFATSAPLRREIGNLPTMRIKTKGASVGATGAGDLDRVAGKIFKTRISKYNDFVGKVADSMEYWLTGSAMGAGKRYAKQLGLTGKDADIFANWMGGATQSSYNKEARPLVMNNLALRSAFPFQTYAFEMYRYLKTLVGQGGGMPLVKSQRFSQAIMLLAGMYVYNKFSEKTIGRSLNSLGSAIPLVGSVVDEGITQVAQVAGLKDKEYRGTGRGPVAPHEDIKSFVYATDALVNYNNMQPLRKELVKWGMGFSGVAGASTVNRFVDGMIATTQGYQHTRSGKIAFPIRGVDRLLAPVVGPYSTRAGLKYTSGETKYLGDKQTARVKAGMSTYEKEIQGRYKNEAVKLILNGKNDKAADLIEQKGVKVSKKDIQTAAKKEIVSLILKGDKNKAADLMEMYNIKITKKDIYGN